MQPTVRDAVRSDADEIRAVASAAWQGTYAGLLQPSTIDAFVESAYSIEMLKRRIARHTFLVAEKEGRILAFANAVIGDDAVNLAAIYTHPDNRGQGLGTMLLSALRSRFPGLPIAADVLTGNRKGEVFYERRGFVPRETLQAELFGEPVVERRWWLGTPPGPPTTPTAHMTFVNSERAHGRRVSGGACIIGRMDAEGPSLDEGPFFHGTKADLRVGDLLTPGFRSNYRADVVMNHIYFTALRDGAGLAAELAPGDGPPRVYVVEPTGPFEDDPNVTDRKFPGNPTRSYRSRAPLRVVGEVTDWTRQTPEALQAWRDRLAAIRGGERGEIIN